ncbi:MAG: SLC13 family permease [Chthoniobacterales bacterium]
MTPSVVLLFARQPTLHLEIAIVLGLLAAGVILFSLEKYSVDVITLLLLLGLLLTGILTPAEAFAGFSSDILIILASIFVISGALQETGVLDTASDWLARFAGNSPRRLFAAIMILPAGLSGFMNNTTVTAMFVPPVVGLARRAKMSPSRLLMPLAFASILGGTCTLIGTSTNVAVSGYIQKIGLEPVGLFEITPIGLIITGIGLTFLFVTRSSLIPDRSGQELTDDYDLRAYLSEVTVLPDSPLIGQMPLESDLGLLEFRILRSTRNDTPLDAHSAPPIAAEDILLIEGSARNLLKIQTIEGVAFVGQRSLRTISSTNSRVVEAVVPPRSKLVGQTLEEAAFRPQFGTVVLAIYRRGRSISETLPATRIVSGDVLLLQGPNERIDALRDADQLSILGELSAAPSDRRSGLIALGAFAMAILAAAFGWTALPTAFLAAALVVVLARCITIEKAYTIIDWRLLILIGGMTAFGTAMQTSGTAALLAQGVLATLSPLGILAVLAGFFVLTILLTQPMSNAAAALVVLPVALEAAQAIGANERTFAIAVMLAASISFITPFEPSCVLVYGPGKYRFGDFVRAGGWLTVILAVVVITLIPVFWPLQATR